MELDNIPEEEFDSVLKEVEEVANPPQKKARKPEKSQTENKRNKLIELSKDGVIDKTAVFIRKSNKDVIDKLYDNYERERMSYASEFLSNLIISKFVSVLGSFNMVESSDQLSEELLGDKLLKDDVAYLTRTVSPNIPFIGLISGGCTTAKHVVAHKWNKKEEAKHLLLHTECHNSENPITGETPGMEQSSNP